MGKPKRLIIWVLLLSVIVSGLTGYCGYSYGIAEGTESGYSDGYAEGKQQGRKAGYDSGYSKGFAEGRESQSWGAGNTPQLDSLPKKAPVYDPIVYVTDSGSKYHRADCQYLWNSCNSIRLSSAKNNGYSPCSVCNPPN